MFSDSFDCRSKGDGDFLVAKRRTFVVYDALKLCMEFVAEELGQSLGGRKTCEWLQDDGRLTNVGGRVLATSNMPEATVTRYNTLFET